MVSDWEFLGLGAAFSGKPVAGAPFAYLDTRESSGNVTVRLVQRH